jgi:hypothetical protein
MGRSTEDQVTCLLAIKEVVEQRVQDLSAEGLRAFVPFVRDRGPGLFTPLFGQQMDVIDLSWMNPTAMMVFESSFVEEVSGWNIKDFFKGATTVCAYLDENQAQHAGDFMKAAREAMYQLVLSDENPYPAIVTDLLPAYLSCVTLTLCGEEMTTWRPQLAYALGFLWMLGHMENTTKLRDVKTRLPYREQACAILIEHMRKGSYLG